MAGAVTHNPVFRGLEHRWRGPLPCTSVELSIGLVAGGLLTLAVHAVVGVVAGLGVVAALVMWRRVDHDRSDYIRAALRRFVRVRAYNANEHDLDFVPFEPR